MNRKGKTIARSFPLLLALCVAAPALAQQPASPLAQALSSASMTASQELSAATAQTIESGVHALMPKRQTPQPHVNSTTSLPMERLVAKKVREYALETPSSSELPAPSARKPSDGRHTLFVEAAQRKLHLEAPKSMCFLDRTSPLQQSAYIALAAAAERNGDQVALGVFLPCDNVTGPEDWQDGLPSAGFVTWLNPAIGDTTSMSLPDYLDMREAAFMPYAKSRNIGTRPDKAVHRNAYTVSLAFADDNKMPDGSEQHNVSIIATTLLRQVPVEITLHLTGDASANKGARDFSMAYDTMDRLIAQLITLNQ